MEHFEITGMSCAACSSRVEKAVGSLEGVQECTVNLLTNSMIVEGRATREEITAAVKKAGYGVVEKPEDKKKTTGEDTTDKEVKKLRKRLVVSLVFLLVLMYFSMGHMMWNWPVPGFMEGNRYDTFFLFGPEGLKHVYNSATLGNAVNGVSATDRWIIDDAAGTATTNEDRTQMLWFKNEYSSDFIMEADVIVHKPSEGYHPSVGLISYANQENIGLYAYTGRSLTDNAAGNKVISLKTGTMPDVRGMGLKDALFVLESRGLKVRFSGRGAVVRQSVAPGARITPGATVAITLN